MAFEILVASADPAIRAQAAAMVREDAELALAGTAQSVDEIYGAIERAPVDAMLVHEQLGPLPIMDVVRDLGARFPHVGVVLAIKEGGTRVLRSALQAGARDVIELPLGLEELEAGLKAAARWSRSVRPPEVDVDADEEEAVGPVGRMVALVGAKGGVGTTTLALQLALAVSRARGNRSVCLVDFDLQSGDLGVMLDVAHHRSIVDLIGLPDVSAPQLEGTVYGHPSGLRVLLAPAEGERGEELTAHDARTILSALKRTYDVVVVDGGAVLTEGNAPAAEVADEVLLVITPDVPAVRAANRVRALWGRLGIEPARARVLVNRASKTTEVQPDLIRKVVDLPLAVNQVPAKFSDLEGTVNTGTPERLPEGSVRSAIDKLAREVLSPEAAPAAESKPTRRLARLRAEAGQAAVETMGTTGIIILVALGLWQAVLAGYTYILSGHAAREGARQVAVGRPAESRAREDLPSGWHDSLRVKEGSRSVEVSLAVPALIPGVDTPVRVSASAGTVREGGAP